MEQEQQQEQVCERSLLPLRTYYRWWLFGSVERSRANTERKRKVIRKLDTPEGEKYRALNRENQRRWREQNMEKNREKARLGMRKIAARKKAQRLAAAAAAAAALLENKCENKNENQNGT